MKPNRTNKILSWLRVIVVIALLGGFIWLAGFYLRWDWPDFWSNFISNAGSSAVIGYVLYWLITRPDEKKAVENRRDQALAMLKAEFNINLERAKLYEEALKKPKGDLSHLYPLRFTRGAWNALKESGFLPQFEDVELIYELLRVNEFITNCNSSLLRVRSAKAASEQRKLNFYAKKAMNECRQIQKLLPLILDKLSKMNLPVIELDRFDEEIDDDAIEED